MKIATTVIALAIALGASKVVAGPGSFGLGGTNVCSTNLVHTNLFGTNHLGPLAQYDLDGDGAITSTEFATVASNMVQQLESRFLTKFDADGDGTVTTNEALAVYEAFAEHWLTNLLAHFDLNRDGAIETNELPRFGWNPGRPSLASYDANGDGIVSADELVAAAEALADDLLARLFAKYDTNGDGVISEEESLAVEQALVDAKIAAILAKFDLDHDGNVSSAEVNSVLQYRRPEDFGGIGRNAVLLERLAKCYGTHVDSLTPHPGPLPVEGRGRAVVPAPLLPFETIEFLSLTPS